MNTAKKLFLDINLIVVLFIPALFVGTVVKMNSPDCVTCGVTITTTLWFIGVLALQPVLWAKTLTSRSRVMAWGVSVAGGISVYLLAEAIGIGTFSAGAVSTGLSIGFLSNLLGQFAALFFSIAIVRKASKQTQVISAMTESKGRTIKPVSGRASNNWWRNRSKQFRAWVFGSIVWIIFVFLYALVFEPFGYDGLSYMDVEQFFQMFFIMAAPLLAGGIKYAYDKIVK